MLLYTRSGRGRGSERERKTTGGMVVPAIHNGISDMSMLCMLLYTENGRRRRGKRKGGRRHTRNTLCILNSIKVKVAGIYCIYIGSGKWREREGRDREGGRGRIRNCTWTCTGWYMYMYLPLKLTLEVRRLRFSEVDREIL